MSGQIELIHGDGGKYTNILINELFYKYFDNEILLKGSDSAVFQTNGHRLAFTTDSFVIKPLFFPGGNIGKLAVCGTVNDLAVSGAKPLYLSTGFIIEEGFNFADLERIVQGMSHECKKTGVKVITGDTKVVEKGSMDGLFINTAGIGVIENNYLTKEVNPGDDIIVTGSIAEHGTAIALERYNIKAAGDFYSDCAPIYNIIRSIKPFYNGIKLMKDPTRGGLATALNEIAAAAGMGIKIFEGALPIRKEVIAICSLLGIDPLYLACEGRALIAVDPCISEGMLECIRSCENGKNANIIGCFYSNKDSIVHLETNIGGKRLLHPLDTPMLPRIC
jgi:hydrogenase expression/formation protein HypE